MTTSMPRRPARALLLCAASLFALAAGRAAAQEAPRPEAAAPQEVVITSARTTRSAVSITAGEIQKLLPGINPLKSIETLPGVTFQTADPWGVDEQNESVFVHGFSTQQLGYTLDGVPLGDQQYGNYNGLSPARAISSENVSRVELSSGAGALGVASTSNLGAVIETFSRDPQRAFGGDIRETVGPYDGTRTFLRLDSGTFMGGAGYVSYLHQSARAWDFHGRQGGDQVNAKYVHEDGRGKFSAFLDYSNKIYPNEDSTGFGNQQTAAAQGFTPYTRPYLYPDLARAIAYLQGNPAQPGTPPVGAGNNFSNYFSAEQREDILGYVKYDYTVAPGLTWSNQLYDHYDYGRGIVAGPVNQAGLPGLFAAYFPGSVAGGSATSTGSLTNLVNLFGGTGYEVRTTEYHIKRWGELSTLNWDLGPHKIEAGLWYEHNSEGQHRVWYPLSAANNDLTPYDAPKGPYVFTQDAVNFSVDDLQLHLQDQWRILPNLLLQFGDKVSLQRAKGQVLIQQKNLPTAAVPVQFPSGTIITREWFLPQIGFTYDWTPHEQVFGNIQKNLRQFIPYSQGGNFYGTAPWSLGTQAAFDLFKSTVNPESSWTYEIGVRTKRPVELGFITAIEGQANYYHVNFSNRILNVAPYNFINPAPSILVNVGGVTTDGVDVAGTLRFGPHWSLYNAVSYNKSTYDQNYSSGKDASGNPIVVPIAGKNVPGEPQWSDKIILSTHYGPFEAQISGDYLGKRYASYLNDQQVKSTFLTGLEASYRFDTLPVTWLRTAKISANITNLTQEKGVSTVVITSASGGYQAYPIAPRMLFLTLQATF
jgi:outer membrane receptor protein involved in Fe transport